MKQYEISNNDKVIGKVSIYNSNINKDLSNSLIESINGIEFKKKQSSKQIYEIEYKINNLDDLYDIISQYIYEQDKIFEKIEEIKIYNKIKSIKKSTIIKLPVYEFQLIKLNKSKINIDFYSLFLSKIHFIKNSTTDNALINNLNSIIDSYNEYKNNNEYEFLTEDEKEKEQKEFIERLDSLISKVEKISNNRYGEDYIIPIKISNN